MITLDKEQVTVLHNVSWPKRFGLLICENVLKIIVRKQIFWLGDFQVFTGNAATISRELFTVMFAFTSGLQNAVKEQGFGLKICLGENGVRASGMFSSLVLIAFPQWWRPLGSITRLSMIGLKDCQRLLTHTSRELAQERLRTGPTSWDRDEYKELPLVCRFDTDDIQRTPCRGTRWVGRTHPCHMPYIVHTVIGFRGDGARTWSHRLSEPLASSSFLFVVMVLYDVVTIHCVHIRVPVAKLQKCQYFCN
jgi:hypothetical protein